MHRLCIWRLAPGTSAVVEHGKARSPLLAPQHPCRSSLTRHCNMLPCHHAQLLMPTYTHCLKLTSTTAVALKVRLAIECRARPAAHAEPYSRTVLWLQSKA